MINRFRYMRIQGKETSYITGKPVGLFSLNWRRIREGVYSEHDANAFYKINDWFKENLPEPPFYSNDNKEGAITYYKTANFDDMHDNTVALLDLLDKYDVAYEILYTNYVGNIICEDSYQVGVIDD